MIVISTQCFPPRRGGIENLMAGLAVSLGRAGREVLVLADRVGAGAPRDSEHYRLQAFGGWKPWRRWRKVQAVRRLVRGGGVEGVFTDSWKSAEHLSGLGVPLAVLAHGMEFPANPEAAKRERIRRALAPAQAVIANSAYTAGLVRPYLGANTRLVVINPPIGPQPEASQEALAAVDERLGGGEPVLLTLGRLEPRKGVDKVIGALPGLRLQHPQLQYIVAGGGDDRARLEALAEHLGVSDCVHFVGPVDDPDKAALYARADLFAMPARREGNSVEGFGIVYREANWYGVPALAGREGGAADAVVDGETGLLCDASDQAEVTAYLESLLGDREQLRRMGENAARLARGDGQWQAAVGRFLEALR